MPFTLRIRGSLARYLLNNPDAELRRRLAILRQNPFPLGSRALESDASWHEIAARLPDVQTYIYGTDERALVFSVDSQRNILLVEFAIVDRTPVP